METPLSKPYLARSRKVWFIALLKSVGLVSEFSLAYARHVHRGIGA